MEEQRNQLVRQCTSQQKNQLVWEQRNQLIVHTRVPSGRSYKGTIWLTTKEPEAEHVLRKIHHCIFRAWKLQSPWQNVLTFSHKISIYPANFSGDFFSHSHQIFYWITYNCLFPCHWIIRPTTKSAFHHCTFQFITPHFVHHFMLKQALLEEIV